MVSAPYLQSYFPVARASSLNQWCPGLSEEEGGGPSTSMQVEMRVSVLPLLSSLERRHYFPAVTARSVSQDSGSLVALII